MKNKIFSKISLIYKSELGSLLLVLSVYLALILSNALNSLIFDSSNLLLIVFLAFSFALPSYLWVRSRGGVKYLKQLKLDMPRRADLPILISAFIFLSLASVIISMLFDSSYAHFTLYNAFAPKNSDNVFYNIYIAIGFGILPAILEGLVFWGFVCSSFERRGTLVASLISSLFFCFLDFDLAQLPSRLFLGLVLCAILYATDSLISVLLLHVAYNLFAVFLAPTLIAIRYVSTSASLFIFIVLILLLLSAILLSHLLSNSYRRLSRRESSRPGAHSVSPAQLGRELAELLVSLPAICCYAVFLIATVVFIFIK